jgi:hypothetical protein
VICEDTRGLDKFLCDVFILAQCLYWHSVYTGTVFTLAQCLYWHSVCTGTVFKKKACRRIKDFTFADLLARFMQKKKTMLK